jgi:hypothetical protein
MAHTLHASGPDGTAGHLGTLPADPPALTLGETAPDAEFLAVLERELEAVRSTPRQLAWSCQSSSGSTGVALTVMLDVVMNCMVLDLLPGPLEATRCHSA